MHQLIERDDFALLAAEAIDAARRSRLEGKASALGRVLGSILADEALLEPEAVWIRIIGSVEPPHIRILQSLLEHRAHWGSGSETKYWQTGHGVKLSELGENVGLNQAVLPLVQDLSGAGLVVTSGIQGVNSGVPDVYGQSVHATPLGAELFARLADAGATSPN